MKVRFLTPANRELRDAFDYYEHELPGLGNRFLGEVDSALQRIQMAPWLGPSSGDSRAAAS